MIFMEAIVWERAQNVVTAEPFLGFHETGKKLLSGRIKVEKLLPQVEDTMEGEEEVTNGA